MRGFGSIVRTSYRKENRILPACFIILTMISGYFLWRSGTTIIHDFANYYFGADFFLQGKFDTQIYDPSTFNLKIAEAGHVNYWLNFSPNTPFLPIFYSPFTFFEIAQAKLIFNLLSIVAFLISLYRIIEFLQIKDQVTLLLIPLICFIPLRNNLLFGQPYLLLFAMLAEGFLAFETKKKLKAIIIWVVAAALKLSPGITLLYLIGKRKWKSVVTFLLCGILLLTITMSLTDWEIIPFYLTYISPKTSFGEIVSSGFYAPNQSLLMLFKFMFITDLQQNPQPLLPDLYLFIAAISLSYAFIFANAFNRNFRHTDSFFQFAIWILLIFLVSPYGSTYARILLLFYYLAVVRNTNMKEQLLVGLVLAGVCNFNYSWLEGLPILLRFPGIYGLLFLYLISLKKPVQLSATIVSFFAASLLFGVYFRSVPFRSEIAGRYLPGVEGSLVLDYKIVPDKLIYYTWSGKKNEKELAFPAKKVSYDRVCVRDGQLYLDDIRLTHSPDNKKQPAIVDDRMIVYLSDGGRGYGFYTLRILQL